MKLRKTSVFSFIQQIFTKYHSAPGTVLPGRYQGMRKSFCPDGASMLVGKTNYKQTIKIILHSDKPIK